MLRPMPNTYLALNWLLLVLFLPGMEQGVAGNFEGSLQEEFSGLYIKPWVDHREKHCFGSQIQVLPYNEHLYVILFVIGRKQMYVFT